MKKAINIPISECGHNYDCYSKLNECPDCLF